MDDVIQHTHWDRGVELNHERGPWAQTYSGARVYPYDPQPGDFLPLDIAHQLALVNRFGGATIQPYSVAQHALLCEHIARKSDAFKDLTNNMRINLAYWGLLHDAPEYIIGDMIRPVKQQVPQYRSMEDAIMEAMEIQFQMPQVGKEEITYMDDLACSTERYVLLPNAEPWGGMPNPDKLPTEIMDLTWIEARNQYLQKLQTYMEFFGAEVPE